MAGTFAHIAMVNSICREGNIVDQTQEFSNLIKESLRVYFNFVELGSVSPDYPLLYRVGHGASEWGNVMHYWKTTDIIREGIKWISQQNPVTEETKKAVAWLFGYAAHVVTDMTIHPVVELKVGPYEENAKEHRICEMHQDAYIYHDILDDDITRAEHISSLGIASCNDSADENLLNGTISEMWSHCLSSVTMGDVNMKNGLPAPHTPAEPSGWHSWFVTLIDKVAEEAGSTPCSFWQLPETSGIAYPSIDEINYGYIENLQTPCNENAHYRDIYALAQRNVMLAWKQLGSALHAKDQQMFAIPNGDLDTGLSSTGEMYFWKDVNSVIGIAKKETTRPKTTLTKKKGLLATAIACIAAIAIGLFSSAPPTSQSMSSSAGKLTTAIQGLSVATESNEQFSNKEIIEKAFSLNPEMRKTFSDYQIKLHRKGNQVIVLICTSDGKYALLEDGSWTAKTDRIYPSEEKKTAEFTLIDEMP